MSQNLSSQLRVQLARKDFDLDVEYHLPDSGITVVCGASGSGKTTLLRCVAGLERAARGVVTVGGRPWLDSTKGINLPTWKRPLGYVFQEASLFPHLNVRGNLEFALKRSDKAAQARNTLDVLLDLLGISHLLGRHPDALSGGERQRVAIARALCTAPQLLLLDEPLSALDAARRHDIFPWLEKLRSQWKTPMLYVTHSADEMTRLADHIVMLEDGRVRLAGPAFDVLNNENGPLAAGDQTSTVLDGLITERDSNWALARINFPGGHLWLPDLDRPVGEPLRVRVFAKDVSVLLTEPSGTSIQNHFQGVVESLKPDQHPAQLRVRLRCGDTSVLLARLTRKAVHDLSLEPGKTVWVQVKTAAVAT